MPLLTPKVTVIVHAISVEAHPSIPPGFRWAIMLGDGAPSELDRCANAGWCPTEQEALLEGETVGATAAKTLRAFGIPAAYAVQRLDYDPIPAGDDRISVGV